VEGIEFSWFAVKFVSPNWLSRKRDFFSGA